VGAPGVIWEVCGGDGELGTGSRAAVETGEEAEAGGVGKDSVGFSEERKGETAWRTRDGGRVPGRRGEGRRKGRDGGWRRSPFTLFLSALSVPRRFAYRKHFRFQRTVPTATCWAAGSVGLRVALTTTRVYGSGNFGGGMAPQTCLYLEKISLLPFLFFRKGFF
jgi:hypothetical protein